MTKNLKISVVKILTMIMPKIQKIYCFHEKVSKLGYETYSLIQPAYRKNHQRGHESIVTKIVYVVSCVI